MDHEWASKQLREIRDQLREMEGVTNIQVDFDTLKISYDSNEIDEIKEIRKEPVINYD